MDGSFFALGLIGALLGYIVGDFQRERRYRREARANLAQSLARTIGGTDNGTDNGTHNGTDGGTHTTTNGHGHDNGGTLGTLASGSGRRAIPRTDYRARTGRYASSRDLGFANAAPVGARSWEFDCDGE